MTQTRTRTLVAILAVVAAVTVALLVVLPDGGAQPGQPAPPTTSTAAAAVATSGPVVSTTTIVQPSAVTGPGPESFTTLRAPGPVQVLVTRAECVDKAGDGWKVTWRITNQDRTRSGAVLAQIDESGDQQPLAPVLTLRAGGDSRTQTQVVKGAGDTVMVTWANTDRPVRSFPFALPFCPVDPADEAAARRSTSTT
jgi:hypothetical protein